MDLLKEQQASGGLMDRIPSSYLGDYISQSWKVSIIIPILQMGKPWVGVSGPTPRLMSPTVALYTLGHVAFQVTFFSFKKGGVKELNKH